MKNKILKTVDVKWKKNYNEFTKVDYLDHYSINKKGDLLNLKKHHNVKKVCKKYYDKDGYIRYWVEIGGKRKFVPAHRIVAKTFIKNPYKKPHINHKNGIRDDNNVENLEWITLADNTRYSRKVLGNIPRGEKASQSKMNNTLVLDMRSLYEKGVSITALSKIFNMSLAQTSRICRKINWGHL